MTLLITFQVEQINHLEVWKNATNDSMIISVGSCHAEILWVIEVVMSKFSFNCCKIACEQALGAIEGETKEEGPSFSDYEYGRN